MDSFTPTLDLVKILEDLFLVLSQKEKEVIIKRFSLNNEPRQTLERIGRHFSVTRERIRQIEKIALNKLQRTAPNTKLQKIHQLGLEILETHGKLLAETELISNILKRINSDDQTDGHIVRLALSVAPNVTLVEKARQYRPFWRTQDLSETLVNNIVQAAHQYLAKKKDVVPRAELAARVAATLSEQNKKDITEQTVLSAFGVDLRFKTVEEGVGLMSWRHINPKSIRDKAYIVLKKATKPLHFVEIANQIASADFDKKTVTVQAVHNELIRDELFVLVGRGLYGLKEWGYKRGTVADIIEELLGKKSPMSKQDIVAGVLKQRYVKKGTISLNLQKNLQFVRVGRAMYALDEAKKNNRGLRRGG